MAEVSPIMTHEAGAGPKVNKTETMRPKDACARVAAFDVPQEAAIPRATRRMVLPAEPQR
jgi:hypothetical protein